MQNSTKYHSIRFIFTLLKNFYKFCYKSYTYVFNVHEDWVIQLIFSTVHTVNEFGRSGSRRTSCRRNALRSVLWAGREAVECVPCGQFFCERHLTALTNCPFCRCAPLDVRESRASAVWPIASRSIADYVINASSKVSSTSTWSTVVRRFVCGYQQMHKADALHHFDFVEAHPDAHNELTAAGSAKSTFQNLIFVILLSLIK